MKKINILILSIILLSFALAYYLFPQMPETIASHWNAQGEADGYMTKFWGLFLMPFCLIGLFLMFLIIPKIDPLKENIEKFRKYYDGFILAITLFLFYVYSLTLAWNMGIKFDMTLSLLPAIALLFYGVGILTENAKRNWFIGIRTPWTLSSDKIWGKTHKHGGKLFKIAGIIGLLGLFFSNYAIFFIIIPVIFISIYLIAYSYFEYQKEARL